MGRHLTLAVFFCLFRTRSSSHVVVYWTLNHGQRYGNVSKEIQVEDFEECYLKCFRDELSRLCHAFNFRGRDGSCHLIYDRSNLIPSEGYATLAQCEFVYPECKLSQMGKEYVGSLNVTDSGKPCLRWDSPRLATTYDSNPSDGFVDAMFYDEHVLNQDLSLHENFCRNPTFKDRPWCFVDDGTIHSEYCQVPLCDDMGKLECKLTQKGGEYVGVKNRSISRFPCLPWLESTHFLKDRIYNDRRPPFPDLLSDTHNYCRNPNAKPGGPWCYIQDSGESGIEWEYCDVPFCALEYPNIACDSRNQCESEKDDVLSLYPECRKTEMGKEYKGIKNRTETGKKCLPWGIPVIKKALENILLSHISAEDRFKEKFRVLDNMDSWTNEEANYCRNPGFRKRPWCFISDDLKWEYCHIPFCPNRKEPVNCKLTFHGMEYAGKTNMTRDGKKCQPWLSQTPNKHSMIFSLSYFPDDGMDSRHNYCRNPDIDGNGPWCYTEEDIGRQYCDIPFCWEMYQRSAVKGMH
ncbi:unnamed protein product [Darwinula stevensoni]|uniref:Kringle domain-containing protein n=1 Tax=Darwinula stevensoni TaxID=69355 RepID=A0A7R8XDD0_9CRUS|nr:unnamed protein product [Darwinula stevensoni]CAG0886684.1 unnamed protein product [Darwinula stevensoni]